MMEGDDFRHGLDWNLLRIFADIVDARGVTRAAQSSGRKQPALSLSLKRLEAALGVRLCERGPRGFALTGEGERVAEICQHLARLVADIPGAVAGGPGGELRGRIRVQIISNIVDPALDGAIADFHAEHPLVEIDIDVVTWEAVTRALLRNDTDIGIAPARFLHAELRYDSLFLEAHRPYCGRAHPLYGRAVEHPDELAGHAFISTGADEPDELTRYRLEHGIGERRAGLSEHLEEAKRLAVLGVGIGFLPEAYAAPEVESGRLWPLLPPGAPAPTMEIFVITNPRAPRHPAAERLLEIIRRRKLGGLRARPAATRS